MEGDIEVLVEILSENIGVHEVISWAIIAIIKQDRSMFINTIKVIAEEMNVDAVLV